MNEKLKDFFKKAGFVIGVIISAIGAFLFGRNIDRSRVRELNATNKQLGKSITELEASQRRFNNGLESLKLNNKESIARTADIERYNNSIADSAAIARAILERAKERSDNKKP